MSLERSRVVNYFIFVAYEEILYIKFVWEIVACSHFFETLCACVRARGKRYMTHERKTGQNSALCTLL